MAVSVDHSAELIIRNVSKTFHNKDNDVQAIKNVHLKIVKGEFLSLIGPSGCGKTTLLRLIAGLVLDYEGDVLLENKQIEKPGLDRGVIFQEHRLLPWMTVEDNVGLGLTGSRSQVREHVHFYLEKVGLQGFEKVYPSQLSGGMAQRVAIARALICKPKVLLLDEPFGALDAMTRVRMQEEIEKIWLAEKTTMIQVTHDIEEAIFLSDRVVIMTPRPAQIDNIIDINLKRSRDRNCPEFVEIRKKVSSTFNNLNAVYAV